MEPQQKGSRVCPRCSGTMIETEDKYYKCPGCGYEATEQEIEWQTTNDD